MVGWQALPSTLRSRPHVCPSTGLLLMLRLSANSSPTSDRRAGCPPNIFQLPKVLTEAEVIEAEAELKALQRHALEVVDPKAET